MSIYSFFMAELYDATMRRCEARCLGKWRSELLSGTTGDVLEVGAGTGINLQHYSERIENLILSEPDAHMRRHLKRRIEHSGNKNVTIADFPVDAIDYPDESFDGVVSTLVMCSVADQPTGLKEIYRLLRPDGSFFFIEHVVARNDPRLLRWQRILEPLWAAMCGNCHITMDTEGAIKGAGFAVDRIESLSMLGAPAVVKPVIKGVAKKKGISSH
jgi:ubiquinone/menaquinone biosynthesis C-methylase UbiE